MCVFFARGHTSIRAGDMAIKTPLGNEIENIAPPYNRPCMDRRYMSTSDTSFSIIGCSSASCTFRATWWRIQTRSRSCPGGHWHHHLLLPFNRSIAPFVSECTHQLVLSGARPTSSSETRRGQSIHSGTSCRLCLAVTASRPRLRT